jgi:hypothetical protein
VITDVAPAAVLHVVVADLGRGELFPGSGAGAVNDDFIDCSHGGED